MRRRYRDRDITIRRASIEEAALIIKDDEIYDRVSDDHSPKKEDFAPPDILYIGCYLDNKIIGVSTSESYRDGYKVHFMVLKDYRYLARKFFKRILFILSNPVYAVIPECYPSVINFVKNTGFNLVDHEEGYMKNNQVHRRQVLKWAS